MTVRHPDDFDDFLAEKLNDPAFRDAYEDAQQRSRLLRSLVEARKAADLVQDDVAARMGTTQSAVSELEGGTSDPRFSTLQRYCRAIGRQLKIEVTSPGFVTTTGVSSFAGAIEELAEISMTHFFASGMMTFDAAHMIAFPHHGAPHAPAIYFTRGSDDNVDAESPLIRKSSQRLAS